MHTAIVIPCLNEAAYLKRTCASLGFGLGNGISAHTHLILVDNGSTDSTTEVMAEIQQQSPSGSVIVTSEAEPGYVPPRNRGVLEVLQLAARLGVTEDDFLILQADADTTYDVNYADAMRKAVPATRNFILEGTARNTPAFDAEHSAYHHLVKETDAQVEDFIFDSSADVIVDDKVSGYLLSDYLRWGGHRREYNSDGEEVYAETSRLFLRSSLLGGRKILVYDAIAYPSRRKLIENAALYFVTAGFPRETSWRQRWERSYTGAGSLHDFEARSCQGNLRGEKLLRQFHMIALFGILPLWVRALSGDHAYPIHPQRDLLEFMPFLEGIKKEVALQNTALVFERLFNLLSNQTCLLEHHILHRQ